MNISYKMLQQSYMYADAQLDTEGRAACIAAIMEKLRKSNDLVERQEMGEFLSEHFSVVVLAAMNCVYAQKGEQAEYYLNLLEPEKYAAMSIPYHYWLGRSLYEQGKWKQAVKEFDSELQEKKDNEFACFYKGNCFYHLNEYAQAVIEYQKAVTINNTFFEAVNNLQVVAEKDKEKIEIIEHLQCYDLYPFAQDETKCLDIPIFINSRDRVVTLQKLITWLQVAGYQNIHILDNQSTYPPLLHYYEDLRRQGIKIWNMSDNLGHKALWRSNILNALRISTPYVYTDSDVIPDENCPKNLLAIMLGILNEHRYLKKIGLSLHIDDITYYNKNYVRDIELKMRHIRVAKGYFQPTDTTFALYRNIRHYSIFEAFRTNDRMLARHIPWYYDYNNLPIDEKYYMEHANSSSTLTEKWKQDKGEA